MIATSRIDNYDGDFVTFHYNRHEDDQYVEETIPVMEFIQRLIRHIPEKHFKMIRYGGIYARHREIDKKLRRVISREKHRIYRSFNQWRTAILSSFGYDPLKCECGTTMLFLELYFNHKTRFSGRNVRESHVPFSWKEVLCITSTNLIPVVYSSLKEGYIYGSKYRETAKKIYG